MPRSCSLALAFWIALFAAWSPALAYQPSLGPSIVGYHTDDHDEEDKDSPLHARDAGVIEGQVSSVDYKRGVVAIQTSNRGRIEVHLLPSTLIQGPTHSVIDVVRGAHVHVFASQRGGSYDAQIVHVK